MTAWARGCCSSRSASPASGSPDDSARIPHRARGHELLRPRPRGLRSYGRYVSRRLRRDALPKIADGIAAYRTAEGALSPAQSAEEVASARLEATKTAWRTALERTYGARIQQFGKAGAERFFPKTRTAKSKRAKQPVGRATRVGAHRASEQPTSGSILARWRAPPSLPSSQRS